uniref:Uncharacterized protein n=1 Tax=Oryza punctata TaxID=4537 RepID=A0A0E0LZX9_ORYPU
MVDHDDKQIFLDTIAEDSSQYWTDEQGNKDTNQYMNEEGNKEHHIVFPEQAATSVPTSPTPTLSPL